MVDLKAITYGSKRLLNSILGRVDAFFYLFRQLEIHPNDKRENSENLGAYLRLVEFGNGDNTNGRKIKLKYQMNLLKEKEVPGRCMKKEFLCFS